MKRFWQEQDPALYAKMRTEVEAQYPTLRFDVRQRIVFVSGSFPIRDGQGVLDRFLVEIELPPRFPRMIPMVREVGHRVPRNADHHMYPNGLACLLVEEEWWVSHPDGRYSLLEFLDGPVRSYFIGQAMMEKGMGWPFGERSHGPAGILECYAQLTGTQNLATAQGYLRMLAEDRIRGHHECPCGSGRILRDCHMSMLLELREKIPRDASERSWRSIEKYRKYVSRGDS